MSFCSSSRDGIFRRAAIARFRGFRRLVNLCLRSVQVFQDVLGRIEGFQERILSILQIVGQVDAFRLVYDGL